MNDDRFERDLRDYVRAKAPTEVPASLRDRLDRVTEASPPRTWLGLAGPARAWVAVAAGVALLVAAIGLGWLGVLPSPAPAGEPVQIQTSANTTGCDLGIHQGVLIAESQWGLALLGTDHFGATKVFGVVWPAGYSARRSGDAVLLLNPRGTVAAREGDHLALGGGDTDPLHPCAPVQAVAQSPSPSPSDGRVALYTNPNAGAACMALPGPIGVLVSNPIWGLALRSTDAAGEPYTFGVIWQNGYSARREGGVTLLLDAQGNIAAREGDRVALDDGYADPLYPCQNIEVLPGPDASTTPSPSPSASVAAGPTITCDPVPDHWLPADAAGSPLPVTLTCENAVAAAEAAIGRDPGVVSIEFHYFFYCPPGRYCAITTANDGHVVFHLAGGHPDRVVQVWVDETGRVVASSPEPMPSTLP